MSRLEAAGHPMFVGWWETIHHTVDGEPQDVVDVIEQIHPDGSFEVFLHGERIGGYRPNRPSHTNRGVSRVRPNFQNSH